MKNKFFKKSCFLLLTIIIIGGVLMGCSSSDEPKKVDSKKAETEEKDNAPKTFKIGDTIKLKDFKVTVNGIRTLTQDKDGLTKADKGNEFLLVNCSIENISKEQQTVSSVMMFKVVDEEGQEYDQELFTDTKGQLDGDIAPTRKIKGEYVVQVPKGKKGLELVFDSSLLSSGQVIVKLR